MVCLCECVKKVNYCVNESEWYVVTCLFEIKLHNWNLMCCHEFDEWFADVDLLLYVMFIFTKFNLFNYDCVL